jgi:hypothetical protein
MRYKVNLTTRHRFASEVDAVDEEQAIEIMQRIVENKFAERYDEFILGPLVTVEEIK